MNEKIKIRNFAREKRQELLLTRDQSSLEIIDHAQKIVDQYTIFALYKAMDQEINLDPLILLIQSLGKIALLPRVVSETEIEWAEYSKNNLQKSSWGIDEPTNSAYAGDVDVFFVPALAFDKQGNRVGFGAGYYDRVLHDYERSLKIGVCIEELLLDFVPSESHDIPMDFVLCEKGFWDCTNQQFVESVKG